MTELPGVLCFVSPSRNSQVCPVLGGLALVYALPTPLSSSGTAAWSSSLQAGGVRLHSPDLVGLVLSPDCHRTLNLVG